VLSLLSALPLYAVVVGRGITAQPDPAAAAQAFAARLQQLQVG
jgi:3-keto-L-gulonate-6-phosphate decarboxylase